jgi:predicted nuclease of predicted toxin-antitoxin system
VKLKLDENIPVSIAEVLTPLGDDVHTVTDEGLIGRADQEIWTHCQLEDRLLITQDLDFSDSRKFQPGSHAGIILVRLQNPGRLALLGLLSSVFRNHDIETWKGCFVVLSETKIRIRRN